MKLEDEIKMKKFNSPHHRAALSIIFPGNWLIEKTNAILKPHGLSDQQYNVLRILRGQNGKPINMQSVQERMLHTTSNATRLVEKLRIKGYVKRHICEENRRMVDIYITEKGLKLLADLDAIVKKNESLLFKNITEKEAEIIGKLLDKMRG
jgi:DNA-binding MarR family transcriptional regulator